MPHIEYPDLSCLSIKDLLSLVLRETNSRVPDEIVTRYSSLRDLSAVTMEELTQINGLGTKKAAALLASLELAKRFYTAPPEEYTTIKGPQDIANLVMGEMRYLDRENFRIILLNTKNCVLKMETVSVGTLSASLVHPREIFKSVIRHNSAGAILLHNHPSGDPSPSTEDIEITKRLCQSANLLGINIHDHIIIGDGTYVSFKEKGLI